MAAWATAANVSKEHFLFGTGEGHLSHFIDVKKIFKSSGNFVIHFHSDFVQVFVVGGVFLLLSLVLTQLFLLLQAIRRKNLVQLCRWTSMITFGIGEISFIETQTMLVFISAWVASFLLLDCKTSQEWILYTLTNFLVHFRNKCFIWHIFFWINLYLFLA